MKIMSTIQNPDTLFTVARAKRQRQLQMFSVAKAKRQRQMISVAKAKQQLQMFSVAKAKRQLQLRQGEIDF